MKVQPEETDRQQAKKVLDNLRAGAFNKEESRLLRRIGNGEALNSTEITLLDQFLTRLIEEERVDSSLRKTLKCLKESLDFVKLVQESLFDKQTAQHD